VTVQAPPSPPGTTCPNCGKPVDAGQPFCLDCGRRIGRDYRRPPNWRIPVGLVALVVIAAGIAAGFGVTQLTNKDEGPDTITVRADRPAGAAQADPGETPAAPGPTPAPAQPSAPAPQQPAGPSEWPKGKEAYTVVLLTTKSKDTADSTAAKAAQSGLPAGVLKSDGYKQFEPGLYVVFAGQYDSIDAASQEAKNASSKGNPGAYARFVEPKKK
jgi:predicted nucleic acid-binding Zn ribbon protein